ncbi:Sec63, partial [Tulasnella sp. 427]
MYRSIFKFGVFNAIQSQCFETVVNTNQNMVISAPTGSGKTVFFELAIIRILLSGASQAKCVYMSPTKAAEKEPHLRQFRQNWATSKLAQMYLRNCRSYNANVGISTSGTEKRRAKVTIKGALAAGNPPPDLSSRKKSTPRAANKASGRRLARIKPSNSAPEKELDYGDDNSDEQDQNDLDSDDDDSDGQESGDNEDLGGAEMDGEHEEDVAQGAEGNTDDAPGITQCEAPTDRGIAQAADSDVGTPANLPPGGEKKKKVSISRPLVPDATAGAALDPRKRLKVAAKRAEA